MPRFAANLTLLFTESPPLERPAHAASAGFDGAEILFPYDHPPATWARTLHQPLALINTPPGDWASGDRGFAAIPGASARFRADFTRALAYADKLHPSHIHVMAGICAGPEAETTFLRNLEWAANQAPSQSLTIEPLNPADMPGYFLNDFDQAARLLDMLDLPDVGLQFDLWHAKRITGDATAAWARHGHRARHVQIADLTRRTEPRASLAPLIASIETEWISAEYHPASTTQAGLGWLSTLRR